METSRYLKRSEFQHLLDALVAEGYHCVGPQVRDGAIHYESLTAVSQLPSGVHDRQAPGRYMLERSDSERMFSWANGPEALKPLTFAPRETLWTTARDDAGRLTFVECLPNPESTAVIGVRSCDLAALRIQDRVFLQDQYQDSYYAARRASLFLVAVNCSHPAATCFCASTGDGPTADEGFDLVLSELDEGFLICAGSDRGVQVMAQLPLTDATDSMHFEAGQQALHAVKVQTRSLPVAVAESLLNNQEHPQWDAIAERCLSCGNYTMVCPTCFCHAEQDTAQLTGDSSAHTREWASCFTQEHSYIHGVVLRQQTKLRYRQWMTHKLATWVAQFDSSGCVGCGRCISWCPASIDFTKEAALLSGEPHE